MAGYGTDEGFVAWATECDIIRDVRLDQHISDDLGKYALKQAHHTAMIAGMGCVRSGASRPSAMVGTGTASSIASPLSEYQTPRSPP